MMLLRIPVLMLIAGVLALVANAVSPVALDWDGDMRARAIAAGIEPIDGETLQQILSKKTALVVDARSEASFRAGHIPGARRLPLAGVPKQRPVVVYCNSAFCEAALVRAKDLIARGYENVGLYVDGIDGWTAAGREVAHD